MRRFTVAEYHRIGEAGILTEDDRVELLEGWIVPKMTHGPRHDFTIDCVDEIVRGRLPKGWRIRIQSAITTVDSEPEPDLAIVRGPAIRYKKRHPGPGEIGVVMEVADASLDDDRNVKARLYARAGIPVYWILNLVDETIEVFSDPSGPESEPSYRTQEIFRGGGEVPLTIDGDVIARIAVKDLLDLA